MKKSSAIIDDWRQLYNAAIAFKQIECWSWMYDSDFFGVENPYDREIGYCCVLGNMGEVFGLAVYLGTEGLEGYLKIQSGEIEPHDTDIMHLQKCLIVTFEDRKLLSEPDLQIIRELGLKFRGSKARPFFRNYEPGYQPWYLQADEVKYLTLVLEQATEICLRFKENMDMFTPGREGLSFVRVPKKEGKGFTWRDAWLEAKPLRKERRTEALDALRLQKIKKRAFPRKGIWEVDFFYSPTAVREKSERPWFPYAFLCVDHYSILILNIHLASHSKYRFEFLNQLLSIIERIKLLPEEILLLKQEAYELFSPLASSLGIQLKRVKQLEGLEEAKAGLFDFFDKV